MKKISEQFRASNDYYIKSAVENGKFVYFLRYEDLLEKQEETLEKLFEFLFGVESIEGLNIQRRIKDIVSQGKEVSQAYKPKHSSTLN